MHLRVFDWPISIPGIERMAKRLVPTTSLAVPPLMQQLFDHMRRSTWLGLGLVLLLGGYFRFIALSDIGLRGDDTLYYLSLIRGWAEPLYDPFRRVAMTVYVWVDGWFVQAPWGIKAFNAGLSTLNILLIALLGWQITHRRVIVILTALCVALSPRLIAFSRTELLHTLETFLLLAALVCFIAALLAPQHWRQNLGFGMAALLMGLDFGVHEDSLLFAPGLIMVLLLRTLMAWKTAERAVLQRHAMQLGLFVGILTLTLIWLGMFSVLEQMGGPVARMSAATQVAQRAYLTGWEYYIAVFRGLVSLNMAPFVGKIALAAMLLVSSALMLAFVANRPGFGLSGRLDVTAVSEPQKGAMLSVLLVIIGYLLLYPLASATIIFPRLFLPALPLVWLLMVLASDMLIRQVMTAHLRTVVLVVALTALALWNFAGSDTNIPQMRARIPPQQQRLYKLYTPITLPERPLDRLFPDRYPISGYQLAHRYLQDKVSEQQRVLIVPHVIASSGGERRGFRHYYGENAVYIEDCRQDFGQFLRERNVAFLVYAGFHLKGRTAEAPCLGLSKDRYSLKAELAALQRALREQQIAVVPLYQQAGLAIYRLVGVQ